MYAEYPWTVLVSQIPDKEETSFNAKVVLPGNLFRLG